jgi:hypothetical protein
MLGERMIGRAAMPEAALNMHGFAGLFVNM